MSVPWPLLGLLVVMLGVIQWQQLGLVVPLITAILRSLVQLLFLGGFLVVAWSTNSPWIDLFVVLILVTVAAIAARQRIRHSSRFVLPWVWGSILGATAITLGYAYGCGFGESFNLREYGWIWMTLAGIACHHLMTTTATVGEQLTQLIQQNRGAIETQLSLGAKPQVAIATYRRAAIRAGFFPTIQSTKVTALVSLPLLMAGSLLAGVNSLTAAITQFSVLLLLLAVTLFSSLFLAWGLSLLCFNRFDQLIDDAF